ncbi:endonuclease MutS2 [candidate division KSB1 bacterium]|nr:endonuclease MutS2 [candidate division KSB1 bacterium]
MASNLSELTSLLEFDKIISLLQEYAISPMAKEAFEALEFFTSKPAIESLLTEVSEFRSILDHDDPFPLQQIWDVRTDLESAGIEGHYLRVEALIRVSQNLSTSWRVRSYLHKRQEQYSGLWSISEKINNYKNIEKEISEKIDFSTSEIKDSASPKLNQIRKEIGRAEQSARKAIDRLFKVYSGKGYLQDDLVTLKGGRHVFPVKLQYKKSVQGLVHDQSSTGATLFIEPFESIELNNEITRLKVEENREIERILRGLTDLVREDLPGIEQNVAVLARLDFIHAKAVFSRNLSCSQPALNENNCIRISKGRHPLLLLHKEKTEDVVPLDLKIDENIRTVVITGPNAGGKTVTLKTVGLFSLMVQSGVPIPADPDSNMPIFENIFVDIGDFQSIEQDLSTFTSHLQKVHTILENATKRSLVLVDEIGIGTDPDEGASLAVAFLEELTKRNCLTIVTTHHGALKSFAYETPGVENGSMEFNIETLQPVYKFRMGVPGSSYAIEIANRLGISKSVLDRSRELLGTEKTNLEKLILELEKKAQESEKFAEKLKLEKIRLEGLSSLYKQRYESIKENENKLKEKALEESEQFLANANAALEHAIKEVREKQADRGAIAEAKQLIKTEKEKVVQAKKQLKTEGVEQDSSNRAKIEMGEQVYWNKQNVRGEIISTPDSAGTVQIQVEQFKFRVPAAELFAAKPKATPSRPKRPIKIQTSDKSETLPELDLRGQRLDDAIMQADKFLDDALLAGWSQVRIIHGKGTGALRKGIAGFLEKHGKVKSKKAAAWNEGDMGVTVVELD